MNEVDFIRSVSFFIRSLFFLSDLYFFIRSVTCLPDLDFPPTVSLRCFFSPCAFLFSTKTIAVCQCVNVSGCHGVMVSRCPCAFLFSTETVACHIDQLKMPMRFFNFCFKAIAATTTAPTPAPSTEQDSIQAREQASNTDVTTSDHSDNAAQGLHGAQKSFLFYPICIFFTRSLFFADGIFAVLFPPCAFLFVQYWSVYLAVY